LSRTPVLLAGLTSILIWAAIPVVVKLTLEGLDVSYYIFLRFAVGFLIFVWWTPAVFRRFHRVPLKYWLALSADLAANYYFQTRAMEGLPASWYIVIFALNPILALMFLRIRWTRSLAIGVGLATLGTLLFLRSSELTVVASPWLYVYLTIGMLTWVIYTVLVVAFQKVYSDLDITAVTHLLSFIALGAVWVAKGAVIEPVSLKTWMGVLFLGAFTPLAYVLFFYALRHLPTFGIVSQYLEPVFGVGFSVLVFHESIGLFQAIGAGLIIVATVSVSKQLPVSG